MKANEICEIYANSPVGLNFKLLESDDSESDESTVLIEGSKAALIMLAKLLVAVAENPNENGFSMSPSGAGKIHFSKNSKLGFYLHCTD